MANIETNRPVPFGAVITFRIVNAFDALRKNIIAARQARKTEELLQGMSDAQLTDIGVNRAEITNRVPRNPFI